MITKPQEDKGYPFYIKAAAVLLGICLSILILYVLGGVLIPFGFSILIAILLNPLYVRLERVMPKWFAILCTVLFAFLVLTGLLYFLSTQISVFVDSIPLLKKKLEMLMQHAQRWAKREYNINLTQQVTALTSGMTNGENMLASTVGSVLSILGNVILIPIYVILLLFYKPLILDFLFQLFTEKHSLQIAEILSETRSAVQSYMQGLMIETTIVCIMNSIALLIIGVPSAIVIGVIGGILNLLPYIGGIIAVALPILMVTLVKNGFTGQLMVLGSYFVIQFIDNNILVPRIVSKKVQINALMSIIVVLLGGALWGVSGMFLSIPLIGVLKIIFDRTEELKPWGKLLGDEVPTEHIGLIWQKRWNRIFRMKEKKKAIEEAAAAAAVEELNDSLTDAKEQEPSNTGSGKEAHSS
jgi:predicted PurR-regulated permease PerM